MAGARGLYMEAYVNDVIPKIRDAAHDFVLTLLTMRFPKTASLRNSRYNFRTLIHRTMAVKELPWCARKDSPNRKAAKNPVATNESIRAPPFGIVAAMSRNGVIGVEGDLPWNIPQDRKNFVELTKDKILVIGRRTFEEKSSRSHISHAKTTIVVSRSLQLKEDSLVSVQSFPDALEKATEYVDMENSELQCWICGGEALYQEALLHPSARELKLTIIDVDIDTKQYDWQSVVRFPARYRWDNKFKLEDEKQFGSSDDTPGFTTYTYKRLKGLR